MDLIYIFQYMYQFIILLQYMCHQQHSLNLVVLNNYIYSFQKQRRKEKLKNKRNILWERNFRFETFQRVTTWILFFFSLVWQCMNRSVWLVWVLYDEFAFICTLICIPLLSPSLLLNGPWIVQYHELKAGTKTVALKMYFDACFTFHT